MYVQTRLPHTIHPIKQTQKHVQTNTSALRKHKDMGCSASSVALTPSAKEIANGSTSAMSITEPQLARYSSEYLLPFVCCESPRTLHTRSDCARVAIINAVERAQINNNNSNINDNTKNNNTKNKSNNAQTIHEALKPCGHLDISLDGAQLGDHGSLCLAAFLKANYRLVRSLSLRDCGIKPPGARSITRELRFNEQITSMSMAHNPVGNTGFHILLEHLGSNVQLSELDLSDTRVDCVTAKRLACALLGHSQLETIDLSDNLIQTSGVNSLIAAVRANCHVRQLDLSGNPGFNDELDKQLDDLLERNSVVGSALDLLWQSVDQSIDCHIARDAGSSKSILSSSSVSSLSPRHDTKVAVDMARSAFLSSRSANPMHTEHSYLDLQSKASTHSCASVVKQPSPRPRWQSLGDSLYRIRERASRLTTSNAAAAKFRSDSLDVFHGQHYDQIVEQQRGQANSSESTSCYDDCVPATHCSADAKHKTDSNQGPESIRNLRLTESFGESKADDDVDDMLSDTMSETEVRRYQEEDINVEQALLQPMVGICETIGKRHSMQNISVVKSNFMGHSDSILLAVMDGHGGIECARFVSGNLSHILESEIQKAEQDRLETSTEANENDTDIDVSACLNATFEQLDAMCHEFDIPHGSCALVTLTRCGVVYTACAGDSRAMYVNSDPPHSPQNDEIGEQAVSHTAEAIATTPITDSDNDDVCEDVNVDLATSSGFTQLSTVWRPSEPSEASRIAALKGFVSKTGRVCGILAVSRSLGDLGFQPFISPKPGITVHHPDTACGGTLVLGCDGLWDAVSTDDVISAVRATCGQAGVLCDPVSVARDLVKAAQDAGARDNVSAVVVRVPQYVQQNSGECGASASRACRSPPH